MFLRYFAYITFSIITARILERRYKVAAIAHAVLFIVISYLYFFVSDFAPFIEFNSMIYGERIYEGIKEALITPCQYIDLSLSGISVIEFTIVIIVPLFSIATIIHAIREDYKKIKFQKDIVYDFHFLNAQEESEHYSFVKNDQNIYLKLQVMRN